MLDILTLGDRVLRSERWHERTARRAASVRAIFAAIESDLEGRGAQRAKDGPGRWSWTALDDSGARVLVARLDAPIPRRWTDPEQVDVYVCGALLPWPALRRLGEAEGPADVVPRVAEGHPES